MFHHHISAEMRKVACQALRHKHVQELVQFEQHSALDATVFLHLVYGADEGHEPVAVLEGLGDACISLFWLCHWLPLGWEPVGRRARFGRRP
jgi:hypothetical protein